MATRRLERLRFGDWPLRRKVMALLLAASTLPLATAGALGYSSLRQHVRASARTLLEAQASRLAGELDAFHHQYIDLAERISRFPAVVRYCLAAPAAGSREAADMQEIIDAYPRTDSEVFGVSLLSRSGRIMASTDQRWVGLDVTFRSYFREAVRGPPEPFVSDPFIAVAAADSVPVIVYASPVRDAGRRVVAVAILAVRATGFWAAVRDGNGRAGLGSFSVLFDRHGIRIAHSFSEVELFRPAGPLDPGVVAAMVAERRFGEGTRRLLESPSVMPQEHELALRPLRPEGEPFRAYSPANHLMNQGVARRLKATPWTLFYLVPEESIEAPARRLAGALLLGSLLLMALALGLGLLLARRILAPVAALTSAADAIAAGDFGVQVPVRTGDELGALARQFNEMAGAVRTGREDLEGRIQARTVELTQANRELRAQKEELLAQRQELERKKAELEEADRHKSVFLANMSHELRTPLNSIIGFSDLLLEEARAGLDARHVKYVQDVLASGRHLLSLINDILDLSKIEAGRLTLVLESVEPAAALAEAVALIRPAALARRIAIREAAGAAGPCRADRGKLRQILLNLLSNAVKFSPEGSTVEVEAEEAGRFIRFSVRDHGAGIDAALRPRLFEPFVQGESPLVKKHQGTGLGLAICKRLAEMHGGSIELESAPGEGAVFTFQLPAAAEPAVSAPANGEPSLVLLVEEDREAVRALRDWLEGEGYRVAEMTSSDDALELAAQLQPAAIVLDPASEGRDGYALLDELRRRKATRDIPLVVSSAPHASGFLSKPVEADRLLPKVARSAGPSDRSPPPLVLVVDDDGPARLLMQSMLTPSGYRVLLAEGGQAGLALAFEHRPDLAIVDLMMPDMSGFEVVAALGDDPRTAAVPVLVLTAADLSAAERDQLKRRARALAQKGTITRADLMAAVRQAVGDLPHRSRAAGPTVLIVDDHDLNRELARAIVERLGFRALCAEDGAAGVEAARRERPALILLDLAMPGMDGYAAARQLRGAPETSAIPLVALTALAMRGDEERAYASGIDAYLTKPIDGPALENVLHHFAGGRLGAPWRRPPGVISSSVRPPPARDPT